MVVRLRERRRDERRPVRGVRQLGIDSSVPHGARPWVLLRHRKLFFIEVLNACIEMKISGGEVKHLPGSLKA